MGSSYWLAGQFQIALKINIRIVYDTSGNRTYITITNLVFSERSLDTLLVQVNHKFF